MKKPTYIALVAALVVIAFAGGATWSHLRSAPGPGDAAILHYACPMHPQYRSDRPGDCPSCGMRLEPVRADGSGTPGAGAGGLQVPAGAVQVIPDRQQTIGVRLGVVERVSGTRPLRTTGRVAPNENATYPLVSGVEARVRDVRSASAGNLVKKHEVLASLYAPDYLTTAQGYLYALNNLERIGNQDPNQASTALANVQRSADTLRNLGVSEGQLEEMRKTRALPPHITIASPVDGFILQRNALVGQRVEAGSELYRVADLRRVWIFADVYESEQRFVRPGTRARVTASPLSGQYTAMVSSAQPLFDETTQTLRVRLEADNPGTALLPGMFVDVEFSIDVPPALAVPADAIVDSGLRKTVFVDRGSGYFEPRPVETGWRIGGQVEVLRGLMEGERIVISGTFLIDSESRMKAATQGMFGAAAKDPVCGMDVDAKRAAAAGRKSVYRGAAYYFCADECQKQFDAQPEMYLAAGHDHRSPAPGLTGPIEPMPAMGNAAAQGKGAASAAAFEPAAAKDLVCGMDVDPKEAAAAGLKSEYLGDTYYFCSDLCRKQFAAEPAKFAGKSQESTVVLRDALAPGARPPAPRSQPRVPSTSR